MKNLHQDTEKNHPPTTMKVCIIGAGFSGLSVAYHLTKHNAKTSSSSNSNSVFFDVQILEARDRIGGRVHPAELSNNKDGSDSVIVDMGGQWIHEASKKNPLVALLKELDIPLLYACNKSKNLQKKKGKTKKTSNQQQTQEVPNGTYLPDGTRIPDHVFAKTRRFYQKALEEYKDRDINLQTSWQDILDGAIEIELFNRKKQQLRTKKNKGPTENGEAEIFPPNFQQILNVLAHRTECYEGGRLSELSVKLDDMYKNLGGPDEIAVGGYHAVLEKVADVVGQDKIHLNRPVQCIRYEPFESSTTNNENDQNNNRANNEMSKQAGGVQIHYSTNDDDRRQDVLFADCCVCTVPLGVLQKQGAVRFEPPLSDEHQSSIQAMGMGVLDKVMMLFETRFWREDFHANIVAPLDDPNRIQLFSDCSEDYNGKPVLAMFCGGNVARRFDNDGGPALSDEEVLAEAMSALRLLFRDETIPGPVSFQVSRWLQDPYAYGAYSFAKVGSTEKDYERVAQPAGKNLFFAGEHTSKHHHSTVHGAWMTGQREADRLVQQAKTRCKKAK